MNDPQTGLHGWFVSLFLSRLLNTGNSGYTVFMKESDRLLQPERLRKIQKLLEEQQTVKVTDLSLVFGVSENTIRRDLMELEEAGICFRTKGGAGLLQSLVSGAVFSRRLEDHRDEKKSIAHAAVGMVHSGSTLFLDSGTTAYELALELREKEHLTVITPSLEAANVLTGIPTITLIVSGGIVQDSSRSMTGPPAEAFFETVHADILFLVVKGLSIEGGLTDHTMPEASVKRKMIAGAEKIVVMADHTKLGRTALSKVADLDVMDVLITSVDLNKEIFSKLEELGVEVHLCTLSESKDK